MIDAEDLQVPGADTFKNKFGIADPAALAKAVSDFTARRIAELQSSPIRGGFDSSHLQEIHRYLFQDVFDWAGDLRHIEAGGLPATSIEESLNRSLDRLNRENLLRGLSAEEWTRRASGYVEELRSLHPFFAGNDLAIAEFATELARKNDLRIEASSVMHLVWFCFNLELADLSICQLHLTLKFESSLLREYRKANNKANKNSRLAAVYNGPWRKLYH